MRNLKPYGTFAIKKKKNTININLNIFCFHYSSVMIVVVPSKLLLPDNTFVALAVDVNIMWSSL